MITFLVGMLSALAGGESVLAENDILLPFALPEDGGGSKDNLPSRNRLLQTPTEFPFRRYLVDVRGASSNTDVCSPPNPTFSMTCGLQLALVETSTTCTQDTSNELTCTGSGQVLVDCLETDESVDSMMALYLNVQVGVPVNPFFCNVPEDAFVGQSVIVGIVCPDGTTGSFGNLMCFPPDSHVKPANSEPLCLETCSGGACTHEDLTGLSAEMISFDACLWEPSTSDLPETTASTNAPSNAPILSSATSSIPSVFSVDSSSPTTNLVSTMSPTVLAVPDEEPPSLEPSATVSKEPTLSPSMLTSEPTFRSAEPSLVPSSEPTFRSAEPSVVSSSSSTTTSPTLDVSSNTSTSGVMPTGDGLFASVSNTCRVVATVVLFALEVYL